MEINDTNVTHLSVVKSQKEVEMAQPDPVFVEDMNALIEAHKAGKLNKLVLYATVQDDPPLCFLKTSDPIELLGIIQLLNMIAQQEALTYGDDEDS